MKTYSRRKWEDNAEVEEIIDLDDVCRLCMEREGELVSIFNNDEPIPLTLRIVACVGLEVFEGDDLPDKICHPCKFQLEKSYNFRKKCEQSDAKLRQHLKEIRDNLGDFFEGGCETDKQYDESMDSVQIDVSANSVERHGSDTIKTEPRTEEDLVGITKVAYLRGPEEQEAVPNSITLPLEEENREACTLRDTELKIEEDSRGAESLYVIDENQECPSQDDAEIEVIADAVKATLANQPGINVAGQLQLKVNPTMDKTTQVEVTTEDGDVIVMEIMTEDQLGDSDSQKSNIHPTVEEEAEVNEDGELKVFACPDCPKSFARRIQLRRHASVHMQQRGFSCGICEKWFPTRSALVRHERIHTGERPFQCEVCLKSFAQKEILFRHLMTHTGQRPYMCPHCNKGFNQKEQLRMHIRTHANADPNDMQLHYCSLCPKVFCHASGLSRHLVTHTGKTFKCNDCDKTFTDKSSLRRHHLQTGHHS